MQYLGMPAGYTYTSYAEGMNNSGQIVGESYNSANQNHAFLWTTGSGMQDLNSFIDPDSGLTLNAAVAINNGGQIMARGVNASGQGDALLLTPVPEPSTVALLLAGAIGLLAFAWRRRA